MTLRYFDSFGYLPLDNTNTNVTNLKLDAAAYYVIPGRVETVFARVVNTGAFSSNCLRYSDKAQLANDNVCSVAKPLLGGVTASEGFLGMRFFIETTNDRESKPFLAFWDLSEGNRLVTVACEEFGVIAAYQGYSADSDRYDQGTLLGKSMPGCWQKDEWFFLEVNTVISASSGRVQVRVNTEIILDLISLDTKGTNAHSYFDGFGFGSEGFANLFTNAQIAFRCMDLYICDTAGALNNTYLGNVRSRTMTAIGAGSSTDFTRVGAATNWQAASNPQLTDASYVYSSTPGEEDRYELDPIINAPYAHGVQMRGAYRMDDATQRIARNVLETSLGTTVEGTDKYVNQTYTYYTDIVEINPDTGVEFTGTEVNGLSVGPKEEA